MHDRGVVGLEYQQLPALVFRAVDREIVEADSCGHAGQCSPMPARETDVERAHERLFFETLRCAFRHPCIEIPDVPAIGDRHVTRVRPPFDEGNTVLAKQSIFARVVDKAGYEKILFRPFLEIAIDRVAIVEFGEPDAGMRTARADDERKLQSRAEMSESESFDRATSSNCPRVMLNVAGISSPSIPSSK